MFRLTLLLVALVFSTNSYANNNLEHQARQALQKMNINPDEISGQELSNIINQFNKNLAKQGGAPSLTRDQEQILRESYDYLKSQNVSDPSMRKVRDEALRAIEKSGRL
jgi:hypothetical protein